MNCRFKTTFIIGAIVNFLLQLGSSVGQDSRSFFPLEIGNQWITRVLPTENVFRHYSVLDTVRIDNKSYFKIALEDTHFYREDSLQNFYEFINGNEQLIMDFKMEVGDSIPISREPGSSGYTVCTEKKEVTTFIGTTDVQKSFFLDWYSTAVDEEQTFTLQRGVGLYFFKPSFHSSEQLVAAIISGVVYGDTNVVSVKDPVQRIPNDFIVHQNFPNPFNASTTISFKLPTSTDVKIKIYDILGNQVTVLINENLNAGQYEVQWHGKNNLGKDVSSGLYIVTVTTETSVQVRKALLLK